MLLQLHVVDGDQFQVLTAGQVGLGSRARGRQNGVRLAGRGSQAAAAAYHLIRPTQRAFAALGRKFATTVALVTRVAMATARVAVVTGAVAMALAAVAMQTAQTGIFRRGR